MRTKHIIEGLTILQKYRTSTDGFDVGAEHDAIYVYATDKRVSETDLTRLIEMGWYQEAQYHEYKDDEETDGSFAAKHYSRAEPWTCYT